MKHEQFHNRKYLKQRRQTLRNNSTSAEVALWQILKGKQLNGSKFRRQHSVGNYILDFYCPEFKLAVELDGQGHFEEEQILKDKEREKFLNEFGIKVIGIENKNVFENTDQVISFITDNLCRR